MENKDDLEKSMFELQEFSDIKRRHDILSRIRFDVTPQMVMEPRFHTRAEDLQKLRDMVGYIFYVETETSPARLMLMRLSRSDVMSTVGQVTEIPAEMIERAVRNPAAPPSHGMYAITGEIRDWLKKELGI